MLNFETKCRVKFCIDKCRLIYREKKIICYNPLKRESQSF